MIQESCNRQRIETFLEGRLAEDEQERFEAHLDACSICRNELESTAAGQDFWAETSTFLQQDRLDDESVELRLNEACDFTFPATEDLGVFRGLNHTDRPELLRVEAYFDATDDPRMLGRFGGYEIVGVVGCGGMGVVLKGYEPALDRYVAIKVLAPHLSTSGAARKRFAREARAAAAVLHENVVAIHRVAEANGLPYLVMPYLAGESLQKRLDERGALELVEVLRIARQVAAGLAAAHAQGLVHRDIKPANVLLDNGVERVVLTDFGLARAADDASLTRSGVIAGTPQYMSPEQARGEAVDHRSDLFSLGSMMYVMCTGRLPFRAETAYGVLRRISETHPHPLRDLAPEAPLWLCDIVARLHEKNPQDRFDSAADVAELLGRCLAHVQRPADVPPPVNFSPRHNVLRLWQAASFRRRAAVLVVTGAACLLLAAVVLQAEARSTKGDLMPTQSTAGAERATSAAGSVRREPLMSEQMLFQEYEQVRGRASQLEGDWKAAATETTDSWEESAADLRRRLERLQERVEREAP
ncbi:MAG: protein kinase [Planctomycetaceae bacterium]|nr:protein kinase [Planctomycetaceae bacterium]